MMTGSEFAAAFGPKGPSAWEAAALDVARRDGLTPFPWADLVLSDEAGNTAKLRVSTDVLSIGPTQDFVRLPLTPIAAQNILNLYGFLMPTPWLAFKMYQAAGAKLRPVSYWPNLGPDMAQYVKHSEQINTQIRTAGEKPGASSLLSGTKKAVVVSNIWQPGKVVIFGWYWPPPAPSVYDDRKPWQDPNRQPIQAKSNEHAAGYVDYSHGIFMIGPEAIVNGQKMNTVDLYQHPTLSKLVSTEGVVRVPRYPSVVVPRKNIPTGNQDHAYPAGLVEIAPNLPSISDQGIDAAFERG